jgi:two-component system chemotaxis sensor kinase CheA
VDIASIEELDKAVTSLGRWAAKGAGDPVREAASELSTAVKAMRRDPEAGARQLEAIGDLFCNVDRLAGSGTAGGRPEHGSSNEGVLLVAGSPAAAPALSDDPELMSDFVTRANEHLESAEEQLIALEKDCADAEALNATFRAFHTIKGMAGFLSLHQIQSLAHASESVLDAPRHQSGTLGPSELRQLFASVDTLKDLLGRVGEAAATDATEDPGAGAPFVKKDWKPDSVAPQSSVNRTVRVDEDRLDRLVDTIGELVIAESMASEAVREGAHDSAALSQQFAQLDKITRHLQEMATSLRMVPLRSTFRRMARHARDLSVAAGKPVDLVVVGEDTELDKEMVDRIADPLTHLLRNAIDHGLETPDERRRAGKPERGRLELRAYHRGGTVNIEVADDGAGIDLEAVFRKAVMLGSIDPASRPSDHELLQFVFQPGLSTAAEVTDVSGRGVGMDVVKRVADGLRGHVEVSSDRGTGTRFTIRLPLTLAIVDGMVLRVADERYVLPLTAIERSVRPEPGQVVPVLGGRSEMLDHEGSMVPVMRVDRMFGIDGAKQDPTDAVVVVVSDAGKRAGFMVCELLGQQQTVIKPLGDAFRGKAGLAGAAIMPDGRVGLILDVNGLVQRANARGGE